MKKKLFASIMILMFYCGLQGCSSLNCQQFDDHKSIWKSWRHAYFSNFGYKNPTSKDAQRSDDEGWWGCPVYVEENK